MYFRIVSGSSFVSDCGLGKKRQVENESKLFIRLLSKRFLCRLHLNYYSIQFNSLFHTIWDSLLSVQFAFIFGAKLSNIRSFFKFAKPKDLGNVYNRKHFKTKQISTLTKL